MGSTRAARIGTGVPDDVERRFSCGALYLETAGAQVEVAPAQSCCACQGRPQGSEASCHRIGSYRLPSDRIGSARLPFSPFPARRAGDIRRNGFGSSPGQERTRRFRVHRPPANLERPAAPREHRAVQARRRRCHQGRLESRLSSVSAVSQASALAVKKIEPVVRVSAAVIRTARTGQRPVEECPGRLGNFIQTYVPVACVVHPNGHFRFAGSRWQRFAPLVQRRGQTARNEIPHAAAQRG